MRELATQMSGGIAFQEKGTASPKCLPQEWALRVWGTLRSPVGGWGLERRGSHRLNGLFRPLDFI